MADGMTRVVLADDHTLLREGLRRSLSTQEGLEIVGEASDGQQAVAAVEAHHPDVVLMDVTMPVLDGIEATRRISARFPEVRIVMLTMHADPQLARDALNAGASGYLTKDCTTADILDAIAKARAGETVTPTITPSESVVAASSPKLISTRETEVLQLIADGRSTNEAAALLFVSVKTVKNHLASAYNKLDAHDRTQAVLRAARLGLITLPESD